MECKYCNQVLKTQLSLKHHQLTAKYCLAKQNKELECSFLREKEFEKKLSEKDKIISEQKIIIKKLEAEYKSYIDMQNRIETRKHQICNF